MLRMWVAPVGPGRWEKFVVYVGGAVLLATLFRFVAYAAAISYAAWFRLEGVDAKNIADHAFYTSGCLLVAGALFLLSLNG